MILDFNPDTLEAKDAKDEYDSDTSDTGSESDEGRGSGSYREKSKRRKVKRETISLHSINLILQEKVEKKAEKAV